MAKIVYYIILTVLITVLLFSVYATFNISVSLKYETNGGCISSINGANLCRERTMAISIMIVSALICVLLILTKSKLLNGFNKTV
jgi:hypothetical protein